MPRASLTFCLAEDRGPEEMGLRVALLSLREHCPEAEVFVFRPDPAEAFLRWLQAFPKVTLIPRRPAEAETWNCKPQALLEMLDRGYQEVIWMDSDILLARSCTPVFEHSDQQTIVVTEEMVTTPHQGSMARTEHWGLAPGRPFPITMNSCVVRVTDFHRPLLNRWKKLLAEPAYLAAQKLPMVQRPFYFSGDQDVLNALLGSHEFNDVPVRFLRRGYDLIHSGGGRTYSLGERIKGLSYPIPPFIHSPGPKPWIAFNPTLNLTGFFWTFQRLLLEVSTYVALARRYRAQLGNEGRWVEYSTPVGIMLRAVGFGHHALRGLPLTFFSTILSSTKRCLRRFHARPT